MSLPNKVAVVTGAASGIGKEIAREFLAQGVRIAIADLDAGQAAAAARELDPSGERAFSVAMNVTDEAQVEAGIAAVAQYFGGIDILVSNAGIQIVGPLESFKFQ